MSTITITEFISIDGVIEDPGGSENFKHGGWRFKFDDPEAGRFKLDETMASDGLLLGRTTYEGFAEAWPSRTDEFGFADKFNGMPKYVVSTTLQDPSWNNTHVLRSIDDVRRLKESGDERLVVHGSGSLARALLAAGLVDEVALMVFPVVLGAGKKLFGDADDLQTMSLTANQTLADGTLILTYAPQA